ncbi:MAG: hypothetical protein LBK58_10070 [Prevotellaceae bacterium]|jgi:hypothetical protein|nr:hypothetical protein [Prevotellaceae bacterium]
MKRIVLLLILLAVLAACNKEDDIDISPARTIIAYMAADNDLSGDALVDLEEMKRSYKETGVNLIVLMDVANKDPYLLRITEGGSETIKVYPEFDSADPANMNNLLREIIEMYPSDDYGLILWSHGTSWLPAGMQLKSFAADGNRQMDIPELTEALPLRFSFILFDACLMGSVEVAYELKDRADYIIASSGETIYEGFPYDLIIPELIKQQPDFRKVAENYFMYYNGQENELYRSATISVVNTRELEALAAVTAQAIAGQAFDMTTFDRRSVQRLDVYAEQYTFDFMDFVNKAFPETDKTALTEHLNKAILYKAHTDGFIGMYDIDTFCGLSCYIPHPSRDDLNSYYLYLNWSQASGFMNLFDNKDKEITVPASESRTNVESINKIQSRQDNLSEQRIPKDLLPP